MSPAPRFTGSRGAHAQALPASEEQHTAQPLPAAQSDQEIESNEWNEQNRGGSTDAKDGEKKGRDLANPSQAE